MRNRTSLAFVAALVTAASCSAPQTDNATQITASSSTPPPATGARRAPPGSLVAMLPANPTARLAIGVSAAERLLGRLGARVDPRVAAELAQMIGVDASVIRSGQIGAALGLDPNGTIQMAVAPLDASAMRDTDALHAAGDAIDAQPRDPARIDAALQAIDAPRDHLVVMRLVLPARDPAHLVEVARTGLIGIGWTHVDAPEGVAEFLATPDGKGGVAISRGSDVVVFDIFLAPFVSDAASREAFVERARRTADTLRRQTADAPHGEPLAVEGDALRFEVDPVALASTNLLLGTAMVRGALANVDPHVRRELASVGLHEANQSLFLVRNDRGAFFDRLTLSLRDDLSLAIRANIGPGATIPAETAWAPSISVTQPGGVAQLDVATAFIRAWQLPGDMPGSADEGRFVQSAREAGGLAFAFAFPYYLVSALRHALYETPRPFPHPPIALDRFERVTTVTRHDPDEVFVGLFPANASANDAACVLVPAGERCTPATRLTVGRTVTRESHAVRLARIGNRFALLVASIPTVLEGANVQLTASPVAPARFAIDFPGLSPGDPLAAMLPGMFEGSVSREGSQLIFSVTHPAH